LEDRYLGRGHATKQLRDVLLRRAAVDAARPGRPREVWEPAEFEPPLDRLGRAGRAEAAEFIDPLHARLALSAALREHRFDVWNHVDLAPLEHLGQDRDRLRGEVVAGDADDLRRIPDQRDHHHPVFHHAGEFDDRPALRRADEPIGVVAQFLHQLTTRIGGRRRALGPRNVAEFVVLAGQDAERPVDVLTERGRRDETERLALHVAEVPVELEARPIRDHAFFDARGTVDQLDGVRSLIRVLQDRGDQPVPRPGWPVEHLLGRRAGRPAGDAHEDELADRTRVRERRVAHAVAEHLRPGHGEEPAARRFPRLLHAREARGSVPELEDLDEPFAARVHRVRDGFLSAAGGAVVARPEEQPLKFGDLVRLLADDLRLTLDAVRLPDLFWREEDPVDVPRLPVPGRRPPLTPDLERGEHVDDDFALVHRVGRPDDLRLAGLGVETHADLTVRPVRRVRDLADDLLAVRTENRVAVRVQEREPRGAAELSDLAPVRVDPALQVRRAARDQP